MHDVVTKLVLIQKEIQKKNSRTKIIAVSKTFSMNVIMPLINHGHKDFGENKIQEAVEKWTDIRKEFEDIKLHMIGKLQSNKVKYALPLFDYIHSLDNIKLAEKIATEQKKQNKKIKLFIQINIGDEPQKSGVNPDDLESFKDKCINDLKLDIVGLMCLPPKNKNASLYFNDMNKLLIKNKLKELSMGMSQDYLDAVNYDTSFVRIGSKIFGIRD